MKTGGLLVIIIFSICIVSAQPYINSSIGLVENSTWQGNLTPVRFSATALGDLNDDGYQDVIITGCLSAGASDCNNGAVSKVYINNKTNLIENLTWENNLTGGDMVLWH
jgi:hypothetical protein